jgi:hypothetical protein
MADLLDRQPSVTSARAVLEPRQLGSSFRPARRTESRTPGRHALWLDVQGQRAWRQSSLLMLDGAWGSGLTNV